MAKNDDLARIIAGCKKGANESFSLLVDMYSGRCFGYFYRLTSNREVSNDLLSELFVRVVEKIDGYRDGSFDGWLFTIASNIFYDHLRNKKLQAKLLDAQGQDTGEI